MTDSLRRHKTTNTKPKVASELPKRALKREEKTLDLIFSEKLAKTTTKEIETFRRELSKRLEA